MKFGLHWKARLYTLPAEFHDSCLDYKKYKRLTKSPLTTDINKVLQSLTCDAMQTDMIFKMYRLKRTHKWIPCCITSAPNSAAFSIGLQQPHSNPQMSQSNTSSKTSNTLSKASQELLDFASLNTQCLYKICKRLDKRLKTNTFLAWLGDARKARMFAFTNHMHHICMQIENKRPPSLQECPICLDPLLNNTTSTSTRANQHTFFVLACGHVVCRDCVMSMLGVATTRGTTYNKIAYGCHLRPHASRCPICRDSHAFSQYKEFPTTALLLQGCATSNIV